MDGVHACGIEDMASDLDGEVDPERGICVGRPACPRHPMRRERQGRRREEFSEGNRVSSDNNAIEMSDVSEMTDAGDGGIVDLTRAKYLYCDEIWFQYPTSTTFHPPCKEFRGSSQLLILYRTMPSLAFFFSIF